MAVLFTGHLPVPATVVLFGPTSGDGAVPHGTNRTLDPDRRVDMDHDQRDHDSGCRRVDHGTQADRRDVKTEPGAPDEQARADN